MKSAPIVKELKKAAAASRGRNLPGDRSRTAKGEAIAWHLVAAAAQMPTANALSAVVFHEITEQAAVADAFAHPRAINIDLVNAQQARRILDRLVGYQRVSELLWDPKFAMDLSAGRVFKVSHLRLVVERERRDRRRSNRDEYWTIDASARQAK